MPVDHKLIDETAKQAIRDGQVDDLLNRIKPLLFNFINHRVKQISDADDILQETLISIYQSLPLWSGRGHFLAFAFSIAKHEISDYYLKNRWLNLCRRISHLASTTFNWLDDLIIKDTHRQVFSSLPSRYRLILILKYKEGLPVKKIAGMLKITPKAAESLLFRARSKFKLLYLSAQGED